MAASGTAGEARVRLAAVVLATAVVLGTGLAAVGRPAVGGWLVAATLVAMALWGPVRGWVAWEPLDRHASVASVAVGALLAIPSVAVMLLLSLGGLIYLGGRQPEVAATALRVPMEDAGLRLPLLVGVVALAHSVRWVTPRAAAAWARARALPVACAPTVARELRRARTIRTLPALLGAIVGFGVPSAANVLLLAHGPGAPASQVAADRLLGHRWPYDGVALVLAGYLVGVVLAELARRRPHGGSGAEREGAPGPYLARSTRWALIVLVAAVVATLVVGRISGSGPAWWPGAVAVGLVAVVAVLQRVVVRRPRRLAGADARALDDELRGSAAHALSGATGALLLLLLAAALAEIPGPITDGHGLLSALVGFLAALAVLGAGGTLWAGGGPTRRQVADRDRSG